MSAVFSIFVEINLWFLTWNKRENIYAVKSYTNFTNNVIKNCLVKLNAIVIIYCYTFFNEYIEHLSLKLSFLINNIL